MSFKRKYALCKHTMRGEHGVYQYEILSLHKSKKDAEKAKNGYQFVIELAQGASIGDRVNENGEKR